ncbi:MAG: hypothetical protein CMK59_13545 [Proteobacteria bacterium]|nr:hypothetical protein [Pseudomonadota bacterium]
MKLQWKKERFCSESTFWTKIQQLSDLPFWSVMDIGPRWTCATFSTQDPLAELPSLCPASKPFPFPVPIGWVGWVGYEAASLFDQAFKVKTAQSKPIELFFTNGAYVFDQHEQELHTIGNKSFFEMINEFRSISSGETVQKIPQSPLLQKDKYTEFTDGIQKLKEAIREGELYQCNLSWKSPNFYISDGFTLWKQIRTANTAQFGAYIKSPNIELICNSPERFLRISGPKKDKIIETGPIKGTAHISEGLDGRLRLWSSSKERAELTMVVDMCRNDLGRIANAGSVTPSARKIRRCGDLYHAEQTVRAQLKTNQTDRIFAATFPPASVTGAPKHAAVEWIHSLEPHNRNAYTGSIGYIDLWGNAHWNVAIRTIQVLEKKAHFHVGCGIVHDSDPEMEWEESISKSVAIMRCLGKNWI